VSEIRIGAPGAGLNPSAPAFSVSRDSAGILIGVRDNAAPQFAVNRDADGLLLSAAPRPLSTSYVVSGYVLGYGAPVDVWVGVAYWDAVFNPLFTYLLQPDDKDYVPGSSGWRSTHIATSSTNWQRVSCTWPVPVDAAYVSVQIYGQRVAPAVSWWTAMQLECGAVASAYGVGGANLLLNPEFAANLSYWSKFGLEEYEISDPLASVFSRVTSLPLPLPGVTTAMKCLSGGDAETARYTAVHRTIALPT